MVEAEYLSKENEFLVKFLRIKLCNLAKNQEIHASKVRPQNLHPRDKKFPV